MELHVILTSAAGGFGGVTGVTIEEAADLSGLSEYWRGRQEPFPTERRRGEMCLFFCSDHTSGSRMRTTASLHFFQLSKCLENTMEQFHPHIVFVSYQIPIPNHLDDLWSISTAGT